MTRYVQPAGRRGSLKWIQRAVNDRPDLVDGGILSATGAAHVEWLSPRATDSFAEYRDAAFLHRLGVTTLDAALSEFWPQRGPQWDALARTDCGDLILVEAKAHVDEMLTPATQASPDSLARIERSLNACAADLGAAPPAPWSSVFYQLTNRIAHLWWLRRAGQPAWLALVGFLHDVEMDGPDTAREWDTAYRVAFHALGLRARHALARYIIHVHPSVRDLS